MDKKFRYITKLISNITHLRYVLFDKKKLITLKLNWIKISIYNLNINLLIFIIFL